MLIYFQNPVINEYPNFGYFIQTLEVSLDITKNEYSVNGEELAALKHFLTLKPV